ncbi:orotidine-5'-phosphate decarboxylase [Metabacillus indicus]|uniref:orotidine-5'-phosphate decarboxylase n=1 Tax=Metabacillus indicus TaxID=246786 RepID=UPI00316BA283
MNERPLIIALDFKDASETGEFLKKMSGQKLYVKVGMELFYREGPKVIDQLKSDGHEIFLDLKLHDIPETVKKAMRGLAGLGVNLVNVHAAGGSAMMESAMEGLEAGTPAGSKRPACIAVTQLTSTSQEMLKNELLISKSLDDTVLSYAKLVAKSGLDGIVCSSLEVPRIYSELPASFMTVTPGIRMSGDAVNDQVRVATPEKARELGSTGIVVGRSITKAPDPLAAYTQMKNAWEGLPV